MQGFNYWQAGVKRDTLKVITVDYRFHLLHPLENMRNIEFPTPPLPMASVRICMIRSCYRSWTLVSLKSGRESRFLLLLISGSCFCILCDNSRPRKIKSKKMINKSRTTGVTGKGRNTSLTACNTGPIGSSSISSRLEKRPNILPRRRRFSRMPYFISS